MNSLAIVLHGISFREHIPIQIPGFSPATQELVDNYCTRCKCKPTTPYPAEYIGKNANRTYHIDFRQSFRLFDENVLKVLKRVFDSIDIFIVTYEHRLISEMMRLYNPKNIRVYRNDERINDCGIEIVKMQPQQYKNVLLLDFENYYPIPFPIERLKYDCINRPWPKNDSVILLPGNFEGPEHFLYSERIGMKECYPDFVFNQRRLKDYHEKKLQLVEVSDNELNWVMIMNVAKHIVIITSCINVDSSPLCYYPCRSLYTPEERMHHTMVTIATIREKIPNVTIVLMNNNELTHEQHVQLLKECDYVFIFDSLQLDNVQLTAALVKSFPNKSCSETASLYYACNRIEEMNLEFDYIWKISGRSYVKAEFNVEDWPPLTDKIVGPPKGHGINNSIYCVPKQLLSYYKERLKHCCLECYRDPQATNNSMVEWKLFEVAYNPDSPTHYFLPCLAEVAGLCTVDSSHTHWYR